MTTLNLTRAFDDCGLLLQAQPGETPCDISDQDVITQIKEAGFLLLKGYGFDAASFESFTDQFSPEFMSYVGGSFQRKSVDKKGSVMSVSHYGKNSTKQSTFGIPLHGEMYYMNGSPILIFFCCATPALEGGETTVCDGVQVYQQLSESARTVFDTQRLVYIRTYPKAEWQARFNSEDVNEIRAFCEQRGLTLTIDEQQTARTEFAQPAVIETRWGGQPAFVNNILPVIWQERLGKQDSLVRLEDGSPIPEDVLAEVEATTNELTRDIAWEGGDLAIVDNTRLMHGRRKFDDDVRQVYSRMTNQVSW